MTSVSSACGGTGASVLRMPVALKRLLRLDSIASIHLIAARNRATDTSLIERARAFSRQCPWIAPLKVKMISANFQASYFHPHFLLISPSSKWEFSFWFPHHLTWTFIFSSSFLSFRFYISASSVLFPFPHLIFSPEFPAPRSHETNSPNVPIHLDVSKTHPPNQTIVQISKHHLNKTILINCHAKYPHRLFIFCIALGHKRLRANLPACSHRGQTFRPILQHLHPIKIIRRIFHVQIFIFRIFMWKSTARLWLQNLSASARQQHPPYIMRRKDSFNLTGNMVFEGFCIDLLAMIAEQLGFHYKLYLVPDGKFGAKSIKTGEWNGMVRELMDKVSVQFS